MPLAAADDVLLRCRPIRRRAFTLLELLAVLVIVVLLVATFVPYAMSLREASRRTICADNLRRIGYVLGEYAKANGYASYPRTRFDPAMGGRWTAFTGPDEANPFAPNSAVQPNDVSASAWLLVREGLIEPSRFVCPSSEGTPDPLLDASGRPTSAKSRGNFRGPENLSYSMASPFSAVPEYAWVDTLPGNFVLVADQAPSAWSLQNAPIPPWTAKATTLASANSVNHRRAGQNVLYASGAVLFETSPYCGVGRTPENPNDPRSRQLLNGDNIYTALTPSPLIRASNASPGVAGTAVGPAYPYDTYLVPGAAFAPPAPTATPPKPPMAAAAAPAPQTPPPATAAVTKPAATANAPATKSTAPATTSTAPSTRP